MVGAGFVSRWTPPPRSAGPATLGPCSSSPSCGWPMAPARKRSVSCFISFKVALPHGPARAARRGHSAPSPLTTADRRLVCVRPLLGGLSLRSARRHQRRRPLPRGSSEALRRWRRRRSVSPPSRRSFRRRPFCTPWRARVSRLRRRSPWQGFVSMGSDSSGAWTTPASPFAGKSGHAVTSPPRWLSTASLSS